MTKDGRPYGPERMKQIIQERYEISKRIHTSYTELADVTPFERSCLLQCIKHDMQHDLELTKKLQESIRK